MSLAALPDPVADALGTWHEVHDRIAPGAVEGLYLVGSLALADDRATVVAMVAAMDTMIAAMV